MKFQVEDLKKVVSLNNSIIGNNNLRKEGPLSNLIFIIREGKLYTLAQGSKNLSTLALMIKVGDTEEPAGVYAIDGGKFNKTLGECVDEVELNFIKDESTRVQVVELKTEFGTVKFNTYLVEDTSQDTRFGEILPQLLELRNETQAEGHVVNKDVWEHSLKIVGVTKEEEFVQNAFVFEPDLVGINLAHMKLRYRAELPYNFAAELDVVKVMAQMLSMSEDETHSQVIDEPRSAKFVYTSGQVFLMVQGVTTQPTRIKDMTWNQEPEFTGAVNLEQLRQQIRISNIFIEDNSQIVLDLDFENQEMRVKNEGVNIDNQSGINTKLVFHHNGVSDKVRSIGVHGPMLLKQLAYTEDELVNFEIIEDKRLLHVTFSEGDLYVYYSPK